MALKLGNVSQVHINLNTLGFVMNNDQCLFQKLVQVGVFELGLIVPREGKK